MLDIMKGRQYLEEELRSIEKNGKSFMGIDGGNINADVWVCGVEFGGEYKDMIKYYDKYVKFYDHKGYKVPFRVDCPDIFLKSTYDRYLTAMYITLFNISKLSNPVNTDLIEYVLKNELYNKNSKIFKLNLFPIAKTDVGWTKNIAEDLGISKETYYTTLFAKRISFFKTLVKQYNPKVIICTSPKYHQDFFVEAFISQNQKIDYSWKYLEMGPKKKFKLSVFEANNTKVIVIPFLGRGNLSSYNDVIAMTNDLRETYFV